MDLFPAKHSDHKSSANLSIRRNPQKVPLRKYLLRMYVESAPGFLGVRSLDCMRSPNQRLVTSLDELLDDLELLRDSFLSIQRKVENIKQVLQRQKTAPRAARRTSVSRKRLERSI